MRQTWSAGMRAWAGAMLIALLPMIAAPAAAQGEAVAGTPLTQYRLTDASGRTITYYANHPAQRAPVLLMLQGSGCATILKSSGNGRYSTLFGLLPLAARDRFKVVAVEKPFADPVVNGGSGDKCPSAFSEDFTAQSWLSALRAVLSDVLRQGDADAGRVIAFGTSEGAVMASLLAGRDPRITHVIAISGSGTTQLLDLAANAYERCFDRTACIDDLDAQLRAISADPQSSTKMAWGHPHKRWTSFFAVDPAAELIASKAHAYIAFGTQDESVPALSTDFGIAKLLLAGKEVVIRRIVGVGHGLVSPGGGDLSKLDKEMNRALDWATGQPLD